MKLRRFLLRYFPPGLLLEYQRPDSSTFTHTVDLLDLTVNSDLHELTTQVVEREPTLRPRVSQVKTLLSKLQARQVPRAVHYELQGSVRAHKMPLTSCAFSKEGDRFLTGSHDNTCGLWSALDGRELAQLEGHHSVVFCVDFNHPFDDRVFTGSFDHTAKVWDCRGACLLTCQGHEGEVVSLAFEPQWSVLATGALDHTVKLWDMETGRCIGSLEHEGEVSSVSFDTVGNQLLTSSFDSVVRIWDRRTQTVARILEGHSAEVSTAKLDYQGTRCASAAMDCSVKLWDVGSARCEHEFHHDGEVQDACFNATGSRLAWAGSSEAAVADISPLQIRPLRGHTAEVSRVQFCAQGSHLLTGSADCTARVWATETGDCEQVLSSHSEEVFACAFNYEADCVLTASKDNSCNIWRSAS